jgi:cytochrome c oxidase subunit 1
MAVVSTPRVARPEPFRHTLLDWLTTTDHKKIGVLYLLNSFTFFVVAGIFALLMRTELAKPGMQILSLHSYNEVFTEHGTLMIFLFVFPTLAGFGNYLVPLQIGALDMAFPRVNALSFWLLPVRAPPAGPGSPPSRCRAAAGWTCGILAWRSWGPRRSSARSTSSSRS